MPMRNDSSPMIGIAAGPVCCIWLRNAIGEPARIAQHASGGKRHLAEKAEPLAGIAHEGHRRGAQRREEVDRTGEMPRRCFVRVFRMVFLGLLEKRRETRREIIKRDVGAAPPSAA